MAVVFDGVGYMKRLRDAGIPQEQAEAHAQAVREYVMLELVTRTDLQLALDNLAMKLTIRLGLMLAAGLSIIAALQRLH